MTKKNNNLQQKIFDYFLEQHNLTLLEGEINDIEHLINTELTLELQKTVIEFCKVNEEMKATVKQYGAVIEQNRQLQAELREKTAECEELKKAAFTLAEGLNFRQKMLDDIKEFIQCVQRDTPDYEPEYVLNKVLDIINKAKRSGK